MHSSWETHPDSQDQPALQLGGGTLQLLMGCLDPWTSCEQVIYLQGTYEIFCVTPNVPKSRTMQKILTRMLIKYNTWNKDR